MSDAPLVTAEGSPRDTTLDTLSARLRVFVPQCLLLLLWAAAQPCATSLATAQVTREPEKLNVQQAWARATAPGASVAVGYLAIENPGEADRLVSVATTAAERAELHTMRMDQGVMRMKRADSLPIAATAMLRLEPRGPHIMFIKPKAPFVAGSSIEITLHFERAAALRVRLPIVAIGSDGPPAVPTGP